MEEEIPVSETLEEYQEMVKQYSIEDLMDIEKHVDPFEFPDRKQYVQELIQQRLHEKNDQDRLEWEKRRSIKTVRGFLVFGILSGFFFAGGSAGVLLMIQNLPSMVLGSVLGLLGVVFGLFSLVFWIWSRGVIKKGQLTNRSIAAGVFRWYKRFLTWTMVLLVSTSLFPLLSMLLQMLMNGIFAAPMFTPIMPSGKGIGILLANFSEFFTENIPLGYALGLTIPSLLLIGFRFGMAKTDSFDYFVKYPPKANIQQTQSRNFIERFLYYFLEKE